MDPRVCANGLAWGSGPVAPRLRETAALGFSSCGLTAAQLSGEPAGLLAATLEETGLRLHHVLVPAVFSLARPERWEEETAQATATLELAAAAGAEVAVITTGPAEALTYEEAGTAFVAAVAPLRGRAEQLGLRLTIEPCNQLRDDLGFLYTLRDTLEAARASGIGVCVDLLWCWRERDLRATLAAGGERIELVQVSDCRPGMTSMPCRVVPGDGAIPLERPLAWILEAGYTGPFDLELLGPAIDAEGAGPALRRGGEWLSAALARLAA